MSEQPSGLDALLDLFVYAPVGLALLASEELPKLAARGRAQLGGQLTMAKVVGQFAVAQGRRHLASRPPAAPPSRPGPFAAPTPPGGSGLSPDASDWPDQRERPDTGDRPETNLRPDTGDRPEINLRPDTRDRPESSDRPERSDPVGSGGLADSPPASATDREGERDRPSRSDAGVSDPDEGGATDLAGPESSGLAIPGYDSLAASQVVPRLAGLSPEELAAVGAYESAHRARRTILNRVRQLQER